VGYSVPSESITILHALIPEIPVAPTTQNSGQDITISWTAPSDNGAEITSYLVTIRHSDGVTFSEDSVACDASLSSIILATSCDVPLSTLTSAPYNLLFGDSVYAKVVATNVKGSTVGSLEGNSAIIITKPDSPINLVEDLSQRTSSALGLVWEAGVSDGGSVIIDYRISIAE
jgi:hypothetical protein